MSDETTKIEEEIVEPSKLEPEAAPAPQPEPEPEPEPEASAELETDPELDLDEAPSVSRPAWLQALVRGLVITASLVLIVGAFALGRASGGGAGEPSQAEVDPHAGHDHAAGEKPDENVEYVCPMHPQIRQNEFGTCPICFMDLVPIEGGGGADEMPSVKLSDSARAMAGVQTQRAERKALSREIDVFGRIEVNETAEVELTAWVGGRIERLMVSSVGEKVRRGQLLAKIYSPDMFVAQQTMLQAARNLKSAREDGSEARARAAQAGLDAARTELRLLGMSPRQLDAILKEGKTREHVEIYATASGTVRSRGVAEGDYVNRGARLLSMVSLDSVWVQLEIYERDLPFVSVGMPVEVRLPSLSAAPGARAIEGRISFIDPVVDAKRRVARARVAVPNEDGLLRPGMFVQAVVEASVEAKDDEKLPVSVPSSAVLWTGKSSMVYRLDPDIGGYVPVKVELGPRMGEHYVIEDGVEEGDEIVTNGAFRIDASLQIRGGPTMMGGGAPAGHDHGQHADLPQVEVPASGVEFAPPVQVAQLPDDVWYCDMGTAHWAQGDEGDGTCPLCNMKLVHKHGEDAEGSEEGAHEH